MTGLTENNDFLNQAKPSTQNVEPVKKKRRTALEIEMDEYPEYYALCEYDRRCLVANNYWCVMYGKPIIEVPPSDKHYHKYFDKKCYDRYVEYQKQKKREAEYDAMLEKFRKQSEKRNNNDNIVEEKVDVIKPEENEKSNRVTVVEDKVIEVKVDVIAKKEEMPIEENKNFLEEKREHPVYPKREKIEPKKEPVPEVKKEVIDKKKIKKVKNNDNNEQASLF